jgi:hypothetical protein
VYTWYTRQLLRIHQGRLLRDEPGIPRAKAERDWQEFKGVKHPYDAEVFRAVWLVLGELKPPDADADAEPT